MTYTADEFQTAIDVLKAAQKETVALRDKRIAELEAQHRWLETRHRLQGEVLTNVTAERDRLREAVQDAATGNRRTFPTMKARLLDALNKADTK